MLGNWYGESGQRDEAGVGNVAKAGLRVELNARCARRAAAQYGLFAVWGRARKKI